MKLTVLVGDALNAVIRRAQRRHAGREKALAAFVELALADKSKFKDHKRFDQGGSNNCMIPMTNEKYSSTLAYRDRHDLTTKKSFFLHAIKHRATLWEQDNPNTTES